LFNKNTHVQTPTNKSSQDAYKHEIELKLQQLLERWDQNQAALQQSINPQTQAQTQAQQIGMMNQNIAVAGPEPIPQQDFSQLRPQSQTFPIQVQESQQEVSSAPEAPEGWKAQWNDQYEEW
jgi:hypothetical protein